ncbi:G-protein coupled receptor 55a [Brachyhypopomus gauderio]|uniref:G-protein coupled receptor 55a n=1 Tax=Brachyhypopomus gauderio TaxID=698409 RepID=UPI004042088E
MICDDWVKCLQWAVYVPALAVGLPLNMGALWQVLFRVRRWSVSTVFLCSLVINDSLLLLSLPFKLHAYKNVWRLGKPFCSLLESLVYVNIYGSILLSVCIAADRYVALRLPFAVCRLRSPRMAGLVCAGVWVLIFVFSIPVYDFHASDAHYHESYCFQNFSNGTWAKQWLVVSLETVFCCSTAAMVFCSVQVVRTLGSLRRLNPNDAKLRNNKSAKIVLSSLVVFLVCFIPYHVAVLLYFHSKQNGAGPETINKLRLFVHSSICVSSINSLADGACYYFILKENLQMARRDARASIQVRPTEVPTSCRDVCEPMCQAM